MAPNTSARKSGIRRPAAHADRSVRYAERVAHGAFLTWAKLVRKSAGVADSVECLTEVVGEWVGCADGAGSGLDLDGAVAGGADELAMDQPVRASSSGATRRGARTDAAPAAHDHGRASIRVRAYSGYG